MPTYAKGRKFITKVTVPREIDPRGRISRMTDTQAEGEAWELDVRAAIKRGQPVPQPVAKSVGGGDAGTLQQVLRSAERLHWANCKDPKAILNARVFMVWAGPDVAPEDALTQERVEEFISEELIGNRGVSGSTVNRYLSAINVLIKFAGKRLPEKPDLSHLWKQEGEGRIRFYTDDEEKLILQTWTLWGKLDEVDFFTLLIDTGARTFSEMGRAPWQDFKNRRVTFWETKTGKARTVPLTTRSWDIIERRRARKGHEAGPFTSIDKDNIERLYQRTRVHLPQLKDTVLYTARHTCCSRLVQGGADLRRVMLWMGHRNITTTMRYSHLAPSHLLDIAHILEPGGGVRLKAVD